jgi:hypothetical protein
MSNRDKKKLKLKSESYHTTIKMITLVFIWTMSGHKKKGDLPSLLVFKRSMEGL